MKRILKFSTVMLLAVAIILLSKCKDANNKNEKMENTDSVNTQTSEIQKKVDEYITVELTTDLSDLSPKQKELISVLFDVADIMDGLFWKQAYGSKTELLNSLKDDASKKFAMINYGPWDRLNGNKSFVDGVGEKPTGANFYPQEMTKEEFDKLEDDEKNSLYTILRRDTNGTLKVIPYHIAYKEELEKASALLKKAATLAENEELKKYLELRSEALLTSDYYESDMAWMDMKTNTIEFVTGPIENYEDGLNEAKAAFESFILIKDKKWSKLLDKFAALLPELQKRLPVEDKYKAEIPASDSDLGAYDAIYYAGDCNAGGKTIAINLPNDENVQNEKGSRRLQLKNSMQAKFDKILVPISKILIAEEQQKHITFDAFFENTMFHEVAHGIGIKNTIDGKGAVRDALKEQYSALEEGKADILGLFIITQLYEMGELKEKDLMDNFVTFMTGIFRSVRFGASSSHGKANMVRFYYFQENNAFVRDEASGRYKIDFENMKKAMTSLAEKILVIQGDGNYEAAKALIDEKGSIREELQKDLDRISEAGIPKDIIFKQGKQLPYFSESQK